MTLEDTIEAFAGLTSRLQAETPWEEKVVLESIRLHFAAQDLPVPLVEVAEDLDKAFADARVGAEYWSSRGSRWRARWRSAWRTTWAQLLAWERNTDGEHRQAMPRETNAVTAVWIYEAHAEALRRRRSLSAAGDSRTASWARSAASFMPKERAAWCCGLIGAIAASELADSTGADEPLLPKRSIWQPMLDAYAAGLWLLFVLDAVVVVVPRPRVSFSGVVPHRTNGPAIEWASGVGYGFNQGVEEQAQGLEYVGRSLYVAR